MAQRARWTSKCERGLVDVLIEYNLSYFRGQSGWSSEGWNQIVKDMNKLFPDAKFIKSQVQDKEAQLKKEYKVIKSVSSRSGIHWNTTSCVINTTPEKWQEIAIEDPKLGKYEGKTFPLFEALDILYEGNIAQDKHCFTSSKPPTITKTSSNNGAKEKLLLSTSRKHFRDGRHNNVLTPPRIDVNDSSGLEDEYERQNNWHSVQRNESIGRSYDYASNLNEERFVAEDDDEDQVQRSATSVQLVTKPKKQKGITSVPRIEESMMAYVDLKTKQASVKEQASQQGTQYTITRCLDVLNVMDDVSKWVKIFASNFFKDAANREFFLGYNSSLRGLWLKKEVDKILPQPPPLSAIILNLCISFPSLSLSLSVLVQLLFIRS